MLIRYNKNSIPVEVSIQEFEKLVKKGKLTPESLIKSKFIAGGKWVSIDNMERFHRNSPVKYPPGPYLSKDRENKTKRQQQMRKISNLMGYYMSGMMTEQYLSLIPTKRLCEHYEVSAASRLTTMPSFQPELVITLLFRLNSISCKIVSGATPIWSTIPQCISQSTEDGRWVQTKPVPFDLSKVHKASIELPMSQRFSPFNELSGFLKLSNKAVSCSTPTLDGVGYRHEVVTEKTRIDVHWNNPSKKEHPSQCQLISSYGKVVREAKFEYKKWEG